MSTEEKSQYLSGSVPAVPLRYKIAERVSS